MKKTDLPGFLIHLIPSPAPERSHSFTHVAVASSNYAIPIAPIYPGPSAGLFTSAFVSLLGTGSQPTTLDTANRNSSCKRFWKTCTSGASTT